MRRESSLHYELIHNRTGWDLPESLGWIDRVGEYFDREIIVCGDDLDAICDEENCLPLPFRRFCTRRAKIQPLNDYLGTAESTVYFGLRADEPDRVGYQPNAKQKLYPKYPLRELGIGIKQVWELCQSVGLLPPNFRWHWVESRVRDSLDGDSFLLDRIPQWEQDSLLAWRSRNNCDRCFYQRMYEWAGLWEHYPERYEDACILEERLCHRQELTWIKGFRLRDLIPKFPAIREKRARAVIKYLRTKQQKHLFGGESLTDDLAATSCGLLCGK